MHRKHYNAFKRPSLKGGVAVKKIFVILLTILLTLLFACDKNNKQPPATTTVENVTSTNQYKLQTTNNHSETTTVTKSITTATVSTTQKSSLYEEASPYDVVDFDIPKMKAALKASETMNNEDFEKYLILNYPYAHNCEFNTPELYRNYIEIVSEMKLAVVDDNYNNVGVANYYLESRNATQIVYTTETRRFVIDINPLVVFEENNETKLIKPIQTNDFSADIFWSDIWNSYTGNIYIEGETYTFRVYEMDNIELVESELSRLTFVKIGDLLNE